MEQLNGESAWGGNGRHHCASRFPAHLLRRAMEIERKFLVVSDAWKALADGVRYREGYLSTAEERIVRVRTVGHRGVLTIKGHTKDVSHQEFEYDIPEADATTMLDQLCERPLI